MSKLACRQATEVKLSSQFQLHQLTPKPAKISWWFNLFPFMQPVGKSCLDCFKLLWPAYMSCFLGIHLHPSSSCVLLNVIFVIDASSDLYPREVFSA